MSSLEAQGSRTPERSTRQSGRPSWPQARTAIVECVVLAVACLITYWLVTSLLSRVYSLSRDDDLLGGMWAVLATIFVLRDSFGKSVAAAVSRMAATFASFVFCLIYLAFLPFHAWALAMLVGASALAVMLLGLPGNAVTAGITTAVIMVVAAVGPQHAWQQPILRLADTVVGVAVGVVAAWTGIQVNRLLSARTVLAAPPKTKIDLSERAMVRGLRIRSCLSVVYLVWLSPARRTRNVLSARPMSLMAYTSTRLSPRDFSSDRARPTRTRPGGSCRTSPPTRPRFWAAHFPIVIVPPDLL